MCQVTDEFTQNDDTNINKLEHDTYKGMVNYVLYSSVCCVGQTWLQLIIRNNSDNKRC